MMRWGQKAINDAFDCRANTFKIKCLNQSKAKEKNRMVVEHTSSVLVTNLCTGHDTESKQCKKNKVKGHLTTGTLSFR